MKGTVGEEGDPRLLMRAGHVSPGRLLRGFLLACGAQGNMKKTKFDRERERDVSEKIALGLHTGAQKLQGEAQFDSRLFNQSAGMSSGFGQEDESVHSLPAPSPVLLLFINSFSSSSSSFELPSVCAL